jgi:hypothetical protein
MIFFLRYNLTIAPKTDEKERLCDSLRMKSQTKSKFLGFESPLKRPKTSEKTNRIISLTDLDRKVLMNLEKKRDFARRLREQICNSYTYSNY